MRPWLLEWPGGRLPSYPVMVYLGLVAGIPVGTYAASLAGLDSVRVWMALIALVIPGVIGSKMLFVATHWEAYRGGAYRAAPAHLWRRRREGGGAMWGGLALSMLVSVPLLGSLRLPFWAFWDVATLTILVGMIFTRCGCLLHGCCTGRPSEARIALHLPDHLGQWRRRLPTPLLEAGWTTAVLLLVVACWGKTPFAGALFLGAAACYALGRLFIDPTRAIQDQPGGLRLQWAITATFVLLALVSLVLLWPDSART